MKHAANARCAEALLALSAALLGLAALPAAAQSAAATSKESAPNPFIVQEGTVKRLSEHVWEIP